MIHIVALVLVVKPQTMYQIDKKINTTNTDFVKTSLVQSEVLSREKEYITNKDILQLGKTAGSHCTTDTFSAACFSAIRKVSKSQSGNSGLN